MLLTAHEHLAWRKQIVQLAHLDICLSILPSHSLTLITLSVIKCMASFSCSCAWCVNNCIKWIMAHNVWTHHYWGETLLCGRCLCLWNSQWFSMRWSLFRWMHWWDANLRTMIRVMYLRTNRSIRIILLHINASVFTSPLTANASKRMSDFSILEFDLTLEFADMHSNPISDFSQGINHGLIGK